MYRSHVLVCGGTGCTSSGSQRIIEKLEKEIAANGLSEEVGVVKTGCFGLCALGPIMIVYPEGTFYSMVREDDIPEIVSEHMMKLRRRRRSFLSMRLIFIKSSTGWRSATAESLILKISRNISAQEDMRRWASC